MAHSLLEIIEELSPYALERGMLKTRMLLAVGEWHEAAHGALVVARELTAGRQWDLAVQMYGSAQAALERLAPNDAMAGPLITVLTERLEVESARDRVSEKRCEPLRDVLRTRLAMIPPALGRNYDRYMLRATLIDWRAEFVAERLSEAIKLSDRLWEMAAPAPMNVDEKSRAKALAARGISLKASGWREESRRAFDEAKSIMPGSDWLEFARLANIAALALTTDPELSHSCFERMLGLCRRLDVGVLERTHTEIDLAMASFLRGEYSTAMELSSSALSVAEPNGIPIQVARAFNILGADELRRGNLDAAADLLDRGAQAAERAVARRFLWRIRANQTLCAAKRRDEAATRSLAMSTLRLTAIPRLEAIRAASDPKCLLQTRWYAAIIVAADCALGFDASGKARRWLRALDAPILQEHIAGLEGRISVTTLFDGTTHVHNGLILITG